MSSPPLTFEVDVREVEGLSRAMASAPERAHAAMRLANQLSSNDVMTETRKNVSGSPTSGKGFRGGGFALHYRTGNLRRSIVAKIPKEVAGGYEGGVGVMVEYAAYHEFGYHGTVQVRAFTRQQKSRDLYRMNLKKKGGMDKIASGMARVRAHSRNVNYEGHPYARPALAARADTIMKIHAIEIAKALAVPS